jgi:RNA polymerase sigma-70 factor (sigma-E family)
MVSAALMIPPTADPTAARAVAAPRDDFDAFYRHEHGDIHAVVLMLTGDPGVTEDVVQEAFAAAYRKWSTISAYDRPGAWVRRVALNRAISGLRRRTSEARALLRIGSRADSGIDAAADDAHADADLWAAVRRLPRRQAQVIALTYVEDLSLAQVAEVLGCSTGAVKSHLGRAREKLAHALGDPAGRRTPRGGAR